VSISIRIKLRYALSLMIESSVFVWRANITRPTVPVRGTGPSSVQARWHVQSPVCARNYIVNNEVLR